MAVLTPEELSDLIDKHGGYVGVVPKDRIEPDSDFPGNRKLDKKSANPTLQYVLRDGTHFSVHFDPNVGRSGGWNVDDAGTAFKEAAKSAAPKTVRGANGMIYTENPDGTLTPQADTSKAPSGTLQIPDPQHPGQSIDATPEEYKAYYNTQRGQDQTTIAGQRAAIAQQGVDLATLKQDAAQKKADLQSQIAQGQLDNATASRQFNEWWQTNVQGPLEQFNAQRGIEDTGLQAGRDAVAAARLSNENRVGPEFGTHFASALQGVAQGNPNLVQFGASDFTYPTPNYDAIAQAAAARAVAHLSPYAAAISGRGAPAYQPSVLGAAANSVVSQPQSNNQPVLAGYQPQSRMGPQ